MEHELEQFVAAQSPEEIRSSGENLQGVTRRIPELRDTDEVLRMLLRQSSGHILQIIERVRPGIISVIRKYMDATKKVTVLPATETVDDMSGSNTAIINI